MKSMWKKLQTWLLIAAAVAIAAMGAVDFCWTLDPSTSEKFSLKFIEHRQFLIITFVTFMLSVIIFFHYDKRIMQLRLCLLNSLILFGFQIWILIEFFILHRQDSSFTLSTGAVLPLAAILLYLFSSRLILKDEATHMFDEAATSGKRKRERRQR